MEKMLLVCTSADHSSARKRIWVGTSMDGELQRTKTRAHLAAPFMWLEDVRSRFPGSGLHRWEIIGDYWRQGSCLSLVGMATGCPAATKFGLLGLWPNPMHYKGLGKDAFQILNYVWIDFCLSFNWSRFLRYLTLFGYIPLQNIFSSVEIHTFPFTLISVSLVLPL